MRIKKQSASIISKNLKLKEDREKQKQLVAENKLREENLKEEKKQDQLKEEKRKLQEKELVYLSKEYDDLIQSMKNLENVVHVNFNGVYEVASVKYNELTTNIVSSRKEIMELRKKTMSLQVIFLLKLCVALVLSYIVIRVVADNETLLESITYLEFFILYLDSFTGTLLDFIIQDFILITAFSFAISRIFQEVDFISSKKVITYASIGLLIGVLGLIFSSFLYSI